jgi:hypothetical protein
VRFNNYMANHFSSCTLIARAYDKCRNRDVTLHAIPGHWDVVGVSDGVDAWVAPAVPGLFSGTATSDVHDIIRRMKIGEPPPALPSTARPQRVRLDEDDIKPRPVANGRQRVRI